MTVIEAVGWPTTPRVGGRAAARAGFTIPAEPAGASRTAAAATAATHATSLGSVLTLQELGGDTVADREARRHGRDMLATLAELQRALLGNGDDTAALRRLAELVLAVPGATDRRLAAMVSAIVLRAKVELARRQI
jgi:hypothetical protein